VSRVRIQSKVRIQRFRIYRGLGIGFLLGFLSLESRIGGYSETNVRGKSGMLTDSYLARG
jgi:hypothetical protein